ncbi:MAG: AzlD domain-containing protein [Anaerolineales bacterium]|nr:AzlD domain-containing protein [Anaerolineales bacterium]MCB0009573.1 AzlD domain-containing protein [Anaerolineales bacterium]
MNINLLIGSSAVIIFLCRLSGFSLESLGKASWLTRYLHYVPIAVFTALVTPSVIRDPVVLPSKLIALAVAGVAIYRTRQFGVGVLAGYLSYLLILWVSKPF